ncbi:hypothetical protein [Bradyrhizobium sp.]|uniref:hypothetical protein n=1 Tax=Bradyrhizobium sp. TaxID=376 RepID=UPI001ED397EE|nr:hypothetical protein [Bradyrhizobium sp.]MBV8918660.1 hypothetical protein [Bradyrhizobium sp.]MBV9978482.1 hypothetical protein [Bradyrhizobium sp.]
MAETAQIVSLWLLAMIFIYAGFLLLFNIGKKSIDLAIAVLKRIGTLGSGSADARITTRRPRDRRLSA